MSDAVNQKGGNGLRSGLLLASTVMNIGAPSASAALLKVKNPNHRGLIIVADLTLINGNGTIRPLMLLNGPGDVNTAVLWQGAISDGATTGLQMWIMYPQGLDTVPASFTAANVRERVSMAVPGEFLLAWTVATQNVTFSAFAYWLL